MKRLGVLLMSAAILASMFGCTNAAEPTKEPEKTETAQSDYTLDKYDLDCYTQPYWTGNIVYQESVMVREEKDGSIPDIGLLYSAEKIISVRTSDLQRQFEEGKDYTLADGKLHIPEGSAIPTVTHDFYYPATESDNTFPLNPQYGFGYIYFSEGSAMHTMQIAVTYTHSDSFDGPIPAYKGHKLPKTTAKLEKGEQLKLAIFGDSISTGANSTARVAALPMAQTWFDMLADKLEKTYELENLSLYNPSVGGKKSDWGVEEAPNTVKNFAPDLCIIGFGMNDGTKNYTTEFYRSNIQAIMDIVRQGNPDCEFVLIATILANPEASAFAGCQKDYLPVLQAMETEGVVVADMTSFHEYLLTKKRYCDMSGNNVNHPNDFLARAYAQVLFQTIAGERN